MKSITAHPRKSAAPGAVALLAVSLIVSSCGSTPRATKAPGPSTAIPGAPAGAQSEAESEAAPSISPYLKVALSQYSSLTMPNGLVLSVKRQPGRAAAAARIALVPGPYPERLAGLPALALACAAKGSIGSTKGSVDLALYRAGAELELRLDDYDDVALELRCPLASLGPMLEILGESLATPAFLQDDVDRVLGEFRIAERRESGDPAIQAASRLRAQAYAGHPYAIPPRGTASSLAAIRRDDVMRFWEEGAGAERIRISIVGDVDPDDLARRLAPSLGALPRKGPAPQRAAALPLRSLSAAEAFPAAAGRAFVRAEFSAPDSSTTDFAALSVALSMLDDLLALDHASRAEGTALAYSAWTRVSSAAAASACLCIQDCPDPLAAKAAFRAAAETLASGRCLDARAPGTLGDISASIEAYRLRATAKVYAKSDGSAAIAARIARDLAAGGDGSGFFRMADKIAAVKAEDVVRVARDRLVNGSVAWIALGDPKVIAGFATAK
jgi:predicted Zn-dependent peptidase